MADTTATIVGNCVAEPVTRYTKSGNAVVSFSVAVTQRRKNESGQWEDGETSFYDVVVFDRLAENVAESLTKGRRVVVTGALRQSSWQTDDGQKRSKIEVVASEIGLSLRWDTYTLASDGPAKAMPAKNVVHDEEPF